MKKDIIERLNFIANNFPKHSIVHKETVEAIKEISLLRGKLEDIKSLYRDNSLSDGEFIDALKMKLDSL